MITWNKSCFHPWKQLLFQVITLPFYQVYNYEWFHFQILIHFVYRFVSHHLFELISMNLFLLRNILWIFTEPHFSDFIDSRDQKSLLLRPHTLNTKRESRILKNSLYVHSFFTYVCFLDFFPNIFEEKILCLRLFAVSYLG